MDYLFFFVITCCIHGAKPENDHRRIDLDENLFVSEQQGETTRDVEKNVIIYNTSTH